LTARRERFNPFFDDSAALPLAQQKTAAIISRRF
jgi:hypothetical protein